MVMTIPDDILVALITAWSATIVAIITGIASVVARRRDRDDMAGRLDRIAGMASDTRDQVSNDHNSNLRDEIDLLKAAVRRIEDAIQALRSDLSRTHRTIAGVRRDVSELQDADEAATTVHQTLRQRINQLTRGR